MTAPVVESVEEVTVLHPAGIEVEEQPAEPQPLLVDNSDGVAPPVAHDPDKTVTKEDILQYCFYLHSQLEQLVKQAFEAIRFLNELKRERRREAKRARRRAAQETLVEAQALAKAAEADAS